MSTRPASARLPGALVGFFLVAVATGRVAYAGPQFESPVETQNSPWTDREFDEAQHRFTFAVFGDLTGGEREGIYSVAVAQLNLLRPEFIIGVGDLIEGGTEDRHVLRQEWDAFDERANAARAPVFYVGGNHDLTNPVMWEVWEQRYGTRYYHFVYKNTLFLVLDTEDHTRERSVEIARARADAMLEVEQHGWAAYPESEYARMPENYAGNVGAKQAAYFREVIESNREVRWTFLFMHKAPWQREDAEHFFAIEEALSDLAAPSSLSGPTQR